MRPLRLKMTGFGPYRETNIIDMESLGRGGLYLITAKASGHSIHRTVRRQK